MSKIYSYAELKGVLRVGDEVSAVEGERSVCDQLHRDGSNKVPITAVNDKNFAMNDCYHNYSDDSFLTLHPRIKPRIKTWDTLEVGDEVTNGIGKRKVLEIGTARNAFLASADTNDGCGNWWTFEKAKSHGWFIVQPEEVKEGVNAKCRLCGK